MHTQQKKGQPCIQTGHQLDSQMIHCGAQLNHFLQKENEKVSTSQEYLNIMKCNSPVCSRKKKSRVSKILACLGFSELRESC